MKVILVNSHRRSGTHFLIDALRLNIKNAAFPNHWRLPADLNLGSLFSKDEKVFRIFKKFIKDFSPLIVKSHLLPEECNMPSPRDKHEELIKEIYQRSEKFYIYRDGKDTLVSLYKFLKPGVDFSTFIRTENDHIVYSVRDKQDFDENRVAYWGHHVSSWMGKKDIEIVSYEKLYTDFDGTARQIIKAINLTTSDIVKQPKLPRNKLWHGIRKKLNNLGVTGLPESSSVRPSKGMIRAGENYFTNIDDANYFKKHSYEFYSTMEKYI